MEEDTLKKVEQLIIKKMGVQEIQGHVDYVKRIETTQTIDPYL
jgi:hypothetical protein